MRKWTRITSAALVGVMTALLLNGCMPVEKDAGGSAQGSTDTVEASGEQITLRMCWWGNDSRHKATLAAIEEYQKRNPNVRIDAEYGGKEGYRQKYATQLAGGMAPDIVTVDTPWVAEFYKEGDFFVDLYQYKELVDLDQFDPQFLTDYMEMEGKLTGLPAGVNSMTFTVDDRIAEEFGVELEGPWSWEKLHDVGMKVNAANPEQYFVVIDSMFMVTHVFKPYLSQLANDTIIRDDYTPAFTEEQLTQVLAYIRSLYEDKVVEPCQDADLFLQAPSTNPKWLSGDFKASACWLTSMSSDQAYPDHIKSIEYPQVEGTKNTGILVRPVQIYSVPKSSKHVEEAVKFLDFLLNDPEAARLQGYDRSYPASRAALEATSDLGLGIEAFDQAYEYDKAHAGLPENAPSSNSELEQALRTMVENVAYGKDTTENIAKEGYANVLEILGRMTR
ncbi:MAG: carbohydrate ABC transporter substrate-binding protein [Enterocloster asparagiformis]|nr:carbohydrate ABC transporter substrate-binding protein [Enterocloster asparagiformis]